MKCPLYFTAKRQGIDYENVISLYNEIMKKIEYHIDDGYFFGNQNVIIFKNENYIVNENVTGKVVKKRKALTNFTELLVNDVLEKLGYSLYICSLTKTDISYSNKVEPDALCFKLGISREKEMLYYSITKIQISSKDQIMYETK
jgi:hypothetical protein